MRHFRRKISTNPIFAKGLFLIFILSFIVWAYCIIAQDIPSWCKNFELDDNLSCGEESLFTQDKFKSFQDGKFEEAVDFFSQERDKNKNNPEILIYLNNAKLMEQKRKSYTIAVVVPINPDGRDTAEGILRGAAQVQEEFNKKSKTLGLKILIVNDANNSRTVGKLAERLLSKDDVVAVVGHYTSDLTKEALDVYQKNKVVVISPTATALRERILKDRKYPENFFFRTVSSERVTIPILIDKLKLSELRTGEKVAIFYTPSSTYSNSAFEELRDQLGRNNIIEEDVSISNFIPRSILNEVKNKGAKVVILIPDGRINSDAFKNSLSLIDVNQDQLRMIGLSVLYNKQTLNKQNLIKKLFIATFWHRLASPNQDFIATAREIWGTENIDAVTAMSYDATLVLTKALEKVSVDDSLQKQRLDIQKQLTTLKVKEGASGTISFDNNGDRKETIYQIVHFVPSNCSRYGAISVPINYSYDSNKKCN